VLIYCKPNYTHTVFNDVITLSRYNFDTNQPISIIFVKNFTEKIICQKILYLPTSNRLTNVSVQPCTVTVTQLTSKNNCRNLI